MKIGHIVFIIVLILVGATFSNSIRGFIPILPDM
jgi:hypothetical protein